MTSNATRMPPVNRPTPLLGRRRTKSCDDVTIMIAIRNEILREGFRSMISGYDFRVFMCDHKPAGFDFDERIVHKTHIFVLDGSDTSERYRHDRILAELRARGGDGRLVVLIPPDFAGALDPAIVTEAGAIITTDVKGDVLVNLLQLVARNYVVRSQQISGDAICAAAQRPDVAPSAAPLRPAAIEAKPAAGLSNREREILTHVTRGSSNKLIARELGISEATVKIHVKGIFRKIGVANRTQAAFYVFEHGWLTGENAETTDATVVPMNGKKRFPPETNIILPVA